MALPFDLSAGQAGYLALVVLLAAFVRGYSGFGFAALVVSSASLITNPMWFVPVVTICDVVMTAQQARGVWREVEWGRVVALFAGALVGVPLGVFTLASIGVDAARAVIALYVLAMCGLLLAGLRFRTSVGRAGHVGVGVISGLANGAAVGGLPVAAFFAAQPVSARAFRATLIAYFTLLDLWSLPLMGQAGLISGDTWLAVAWTLPILVLGIWLGGRHFIRAAPQSFRRFAIWLLVGLACLGLLRSAQGWLGGAG